MNKKFCRIKEHPNLVRDRSNGAILNNDHGAYAAAKAKRKLRILKKETVARMESDIKDLQSDMKDIKEMLKTIINRNTNETT
jgi:predicted transcriptional regulator